MLVLVSIATLMASIATLVVPATAQAQTPSLTVNAASVRQAISPNIYGFDYSFQGGPQDSLLTAIKAPFFRINGGDGASNYNWSAGVNSSNIGADDHFKQGYNNSPTAAQSPDLGITMGRADSSTAQIMETIPINPYLVNSNAYNCSYPQSLYPGQDSYALNGPTLECGSGTISGTAVPDTTLSAQYVTNTATIQEGWATHNTSAWNTCLLGGVCFYEMDNEPGGWSNTHHDWQTTTQATYTTITSDAETYAAAIKSIEANAKIVGPGDYQMLYGGVVNNSPTSDPSMVYYLKTFQANDTTLGKRTLDYLDEHYQVGDASGSIQNDFDMVRSFWDPTYLYDFYGNNVFAPYHTQNVSLGLGDNIELIPRMQAYAAAFYPGTLFSISEYELQHYAGGGGTNPEVGNFSMVDALVEADALGVWGYYGLGMAAIFPAPVGVVSGDSVGYTFLLYRNYDGAGSKFGDTSVTSTSTNQGQLSVYGALRSSDGKLTVMVINKENVTYTTTLTLSGFTATGTAGTYTYSSANTSAIVASTASVSGGNTVNYSFPPFSATEFVFTPNGSGSTSIAPPTDLLATAQ